MKIVIADDHALFRDGLRLQLHRILADVQVIDAGTFGEARRLVGEAAPDYLLIDLMMPGLHWRQELPQLVDQARPGRCVVLSALDDPREIGDALATGIAGFIPKCSDPKVIANALRLIFEGGVYIPPEYMASAAPREAGRADETTTHLTPRQREVLKAVCDGLSNKQIAYQLSMSEATVKQHINAVLRVLGVHNRTEAAMTAQRRGILERA